MIVYISRNRNFILKIYFKSYFKHLILVTLNNIDMVSFYNINDWHYKNYLEILKDNKQFILLIFFIWHDKKKYAIGLNLKI